MRRSLEPELLDTLSPTAPEALHNRRDLRLTNAVMRNHSWFEGTLRRLLDPGDRVLEIGAGTGELALRLARRGIRVDGLDLWPRPAGWPTGQAWHCTDVRDFDGWAGYDVVLGNLIFHQFSDDELGALGSCLAAVRMVVACEPHRRRVSQLAYRAFAPLFGANHVSLHDAHVSIAAGFRGAELTGALGFNTTAWDIRCSTTLIGAHHMIAIRRPTPVLQ